MVYAVPTRAMQKMYQKAFPDATVLYVPKPEFDDNGKVMWCS